MQRIAKNYYEVLGISPSASLNEIEEAYRRAMSVYGSDSQATYSLYTADEKESMLKQVNEAFATLSDKPKKRAYDSMLTSSDIVETREIDINEFGEMGAGEPASDGMTALQARETYQTIKLPDSYKPLFDLHPLIVEQYRILYTKIEQISQKNSSKTFSITSAIKNEGKSTTSLHLAYIMAKEFKKRTLLVECDMRKPSTILNNIGEDKWPGLVELLKGSADLNTAIRKMDGCDLYILHCGQTGKKSSELLGLPAFKNLLQRLKVEFDFLIIDSPPILPLVDMNIISRLVDGVIVVIKAGTTKRELVTQAVKSLSTKNMVGVVLNGTASTMDKYYY